MTKRIEGVKIKLLAGILKKENEQLREEELERGREVTCGWGWQKSFCKK